MQISRRSVLMSTLFGAGYVGLRALATGIPAGVLLKGREALAEGAICAGALAAKAQYFILQTSGNGDPINANAPGTYTDPAMLHSADMTMQQTPIALGGKQVDAAAPWAQLASVPGYPDVLGRTSFWHLMTNTPVHPKEPDVLSLLNTTKANEMLPSLLSASLAGCLGTIQAQPITVGASSPSEGLKFAGQALPILPPLALKQTLTNPGGALAGLTKLQTIRDQTLAQLNDVFAGGATRAEKAYLDSLITSRAQARSINQNLLDALTSITDNSVTSQITAAIALIQMKVTPVIALHIPFGGDNHFDAGFATEAAQTVTGVGAIASLLSKLAGLGLQDQVSFLSLNVFGRTLGPGNGAGRQHNQNHQVSIAIGKPFKSGVIGGVGRVGNDFGAVAFDAASGAPSPSGDVAPLDSLASFGKTVLAAVGIDAAAIDGQITGGKVVTGALA
jgi:hypothetical protein